MKKLLLMMGATLMLVVGQTNAQCLSGDLYPEEIFIPQCVGEGIAIVTNAYAGEYSFVQLENGINYTFSSSITSDYITISDEAGVVVLASGAGSVTYTGTASAVVRFYTHLDASCGDESENRSRLVSCGTPVSCNPTFPYTMGFEPGQGVSCLSFEDVNGGSFSGWTVINDEDFPTDYGNYSMLYTYDSDLPGDDWFFTTGLSLLADTEYTLNFKYRGGIGGGNFPYVENLEVKYGTSASAAGMTGPALLSFTGIDTNFGDPFTDATVSVTPTTAGTYYFGFRSFSDADQGFIQIDDITVTTNLGNDNFKESAFTSYPNPVKDKWHFSYTENIKDFAVFNMLGQKIITKAINANTGDADLSALAPGAYVLSLRTSNAVKTVKIIKQ